MANVTTADLHSRVVVLPWHHPIDLGGGMVTAGNKSLSICAGEASRHFDRADLSERTVLDIGAWNGFFSFEANLRACYSSRKAEARIISTRTSPTTEGALRNRARG
jgi:hypothetical protein